MKSAKTSLSTLILASVAFTALIGLNTASADEISKGQIVLDVSNIKTQQGNLMVALFKGEENWRKNNPVKGVNPAAIGETVRVSFSGLEPGEYGIKIYHDVNADGKLNLGKFGRPSEPYGFSNNAPVMFGPPSWNASHFTVNEGDTAQTIMLK